MRKTDPPAVFSGGLCGAGCGAKWEKWCRGCNLVYCVKHIEHKAHNCKRLDLQRGCSGFGSPKKPRAPRKKKPEAKPAPCHPECAEPQLPFTQMPSSAKDSTNGKKEEPKP